MALLPKEMASVETQTIDLNNLDFLSSTNNQRYIFDYRPPQNTVNFPFWELEIEKT